MAFTTVTNTFVNGTSADAGEVNTNFTDVLNGMSDGTKDMNISALTCAGAVVFNGAVTLGNATGDDITFTGYAASNIIPKTDDTYDLGSSSLQWKQVYSDDVTINATTLVTDAANGRVGIGTASPASTLDVRKATGDNFIRIEGEAASASAGADFYENGTRKWSVYNDGSSDALFFVGPGGTELMTVSSAGQLDIGNVNDATGKLTVNDAINCDGIFVGTPASPSANRKLHNASGGSGSTTLYIGNASINVTSDERLKELKGKSQFKAVEAICNTLIQDFTWNDPSDTCYNNRNARGVWTGPTAQDLVKNIPFMVNAPRKEDSLEIDYKSDDTWQLDNGAAIGVFMKAIQEQQAQIDSLKAEIEALKA